MASTVVIRLDMRPKGRVRPRTLQASALASALLGVGLFLVYTLASGGWGVVHESAWLLFKGIALCLPFEYLSFWLVFSLLVDAGFLPQGLVIVGPRSTFALVGGILPRLVRFGDRGEDFSLTRTSVALAAGNFYWTIARGRSRALYLSAINPLAVKDGDDRRLRSNLNVIVEAERRSVDHLSPHI